VKNLKKKQSKIDNLETAQEQVIEDLEMSHGQLRVGDFEVAERIDTPLKISGVERVTRKAERDPKEVITRFDNKVFDASFMQMHTQEITYNLLRDELRKTSVISDLVSEVNAGKEATIYIAHLNGSPIIVKAFRHQLTSHNRKKGNPQVRAASIANREFYRLLKAYRGGMRVPTPAKQINNTIIMGFIGHNWQPAPQLRNTILDDPEGVFDDLIEQLWIMYNKAKLIHGDLSEYNILVHEGKPVIIDFPQAIDMSLLEMRYPKNLKKNLLVMQNDLETVGKYFKKEYHLDYDFMEIYKYIVGKDFEQDSINYQVANLDEFILTNINEKSS